MEDCSFGESAVVWAREAFVAASRLYVKYDCGLCYGQSRTQSFLKLLTAHARRMRNKSTRVWVRDCAVARQTFSLLATAHDCETDLLDFSNLAREYVK